MGSWNDDLGRRQRAGETGHAVLGSTDRILGGSRRKWRPLRVPAIVLALGFLLAFVGPVPGLGLFMIVGGTVGMALSAVMVMLGTDNPPVTDHPS
jgi:amino acid permease